MIALNAFAISGLLIVITCPVMAILMFFRANNRLHLVWGIFCVAVMMWGLGVLNIATTTDPTRSLWWWKIAYLGVICIPVLFVHFVHIFLGKTRYLLTGVLYVITAIYLAANIASDFFIAEVHAVFEHMYYLSPTPLYNSFLTLFILGVLYTHILLYIEYRRTIGQRRQQIEYFFIGSFVGFVGGSFSFLPVYGIDIYPYLNTTVFLYPIIMGYAIFKYRLMNVKVITTQLFIVLLWVFLFARTILAPFGSQEQILNLALFLMTVVVGILLMRSVLKEIRAREEIERLAKDLEKANARLRELDKLKSEFVSIASHQLRSPLTAIKGYASLLLEGSFGTVPAGMKEALERIFESSKGMALSIEDFLNVSRIEQGRMKYELTDIDVGKLASDVIEELRPVIEGKGLALSYRADGGPHTVKVDPGKIRQVFANLVDNAMKYTPKGSISVSVSREHAKKKVLVKISDTGVGMSEETMGRLFDKFTRAANANEVNVSGTGLGLYVARQMVEAHKGRIIPSSSGEGKGSTFTVELPALP